MQFILLKEKGKTCHEQGAILSYNKRLQEKEIHNKETKSKADDQKNLSLRCYLLYSTHFSSNNLKLQHLTLIFSGNFPLLYN
jgi:hypothetical protein